MDCHRIRDGRGHDPGVNINNILHAAFMGADPKSTKKTDNLTAFFVLLGSAHVKAER